jgi:PKD repeat protein
VGAPVTLSAQMTPAGCVGTVVYAWDFGDGSAVGTQATVTHAYGSGGSYTWEIAAEVDGEPVTPATGTIRVTTDVCTGATVFAKPPARPGVSGVEAMWQDMGVVVHAGETLTITATGTWQQGGQSLTADGHPSQVVTGPNTPVSGAPLLALVGRIGTGAPFRVYSGQSIAVTTTGTLYLTANDNWYATWDNAGSLTVSVCVGVPEPEPCTGVVATVPETAVVGAPVTLSAQMTPAGCVGTVVYAWDFGDGSAVGTQATVTHAYGSGGSYTWEIAAEVDGEPVTPATGTIRVTTDVCSSKTVFAKPPARPGVSGVEAMWQDMGVVIHAGETLTITAPGTWQHAGQSLTAAGDPAQVVTGPNTPVSGAPLLALVGRIGTGAPFRVYSGQAIAVASTGTLYLTANDNWYTTWDNAGSLAGSLCVGR